MKLAYVTHRFSAREGTGGYVVRLATALATRHDVTVYAAEAEAPLTGLTWVPVPALRRPASATILSFPGRFETLRPREGVVHAQGWVARDADVVTAHIVLGAWRHAAAAAGVRPPPGERMAGWWVARREAALFRRARAVIAPSRRVAGEIAELGKRTELVDVIPHGFPDVVSERADRTAARRAAGLDEGPLALFVGDARKGLARALDALARVPEATLAVASHSARGAWLERARRARVVERLRWLGPRDDLDRLYDAADVLLHPTPYDTFGLVVAEAMARGCPAITTPMAGISELLDDASAWLVSGRDPDETADALRRALGDAGARGDRARAVAAARPWSAVIAETERVYGRFA